MQYETKMAGPPPPYGGGPTGGAQLQSQGSPETAAVHRQFPPRFNLYTAGTFSRGFYLGEHQDRPIYYVSTHSGWSGQPDVVLHSNPSENAPPLASATIHNWSQTLDIDLPPAQPGGSTRETVKTHGWITKSHSFSIEVAGPKGLRREDFEWRQSSGNEVGRLGGAWGRGLKLVRISTGETVAICAFTAMSMTKRFEFEYLGSGAAGVLGERFAVMAAITGLGVYERVRRSRSNAAAAGSAAAA